MKITNTCRVDLVDAMGDDLRVVNAARVSMAKESVHDWDKPNGLNLPDAKLLSYLAKNEHWTPFSHVVITLRIVAPIFTARQWFRSTVGVARNEVSRRYVDDAPEYFLPDVIRERPEKSIKQGSGGEHPKSKSIREDMEALFHYIDRFYRMMIEDGVAPEQARMVLPTSHMTEWYETGSLAYFARVAKLRLDHHAQVEVQDMMKLVAAAVAPIAPVSWTALLS